MSFDPNKQAGTNRGKAFHQPREGELLGGDGCSGGAKSCFDCPHEDCIRPDKSAKDYPKRK